jgi:hypothetical protein
VRCPMTDEEELEWAAREYVVVTHYFMDVLSKRESVPSSISTPLLELCDAIDAEWGE